MVLLHGGSPKGAARIAACWADNCKVPQSKPAHGLQHLRQPRRQGEKARHSDFGSGGA